MKPNCFCSIAFAITAVLLFAQQTEAQNTFPATGAAGIGTTSPNASSLLEIKSVTKGLLIPRMTVAQRNAITSPTTGLLLYQTNNTPGFYYYSGTAWAAVSFKGASTDLSNLKSPTAINTNLLPDASNTKDLGSTSLLWKNLYADSIHFSDGSIESAALWKKKGASIFNNNNNVGIGTNTPSAKLEVTADVLINGITVGRGLNGSSGDVAIGSLALSSNNGGYQNTAIGDYALQYNSTGSYNVAVGLSALQNNTDGFYNIASGQRSMYLNTNGSYNSAFGQNTLYNNSTGNDNTSVGYQSLFSNTTSSGNTAIGFQSLYANAGGSSNVAIGYLSEYFNSSGYQNTAIGNQALYANSTGFNNTACGYLALDDNTGNLNAAFGEIAMWQNTSGGGNVALGYQALGSNTTGSWNTAAGPDALYNNTTGSENTALGYLAEPNSGGYTNTTTIGYFAATTASNQVRIGNSSITSIGGYVDWSNISDGRVKKNIKQNVPGLAFINKLIPITYNLDLDAADRIIQNPQPKDKDGKTIQQTTDELTIRKTKEQIIYTGFVAQDVEKAAKSLNYDFSGVDAAKNDKDLYGLRYSDFVIPLVKAVQELSKMNDEKDAKIDNLQKQINELKAMIVANQSSVNSQQSAVISSALLGQNIPNPFNNTTSISYTLPQNFSKAQIVITDKKGETIKAISVSGNGKGSLNVDASTLASGAYQYSLIVDGGLIATKQMVIAK